MTQLKSKNFFFKKVSKSHLHLFYLQDGDILESEKIGENARASVERETFQDLKANKSKAGTIVADIGIWDRALSHSEMVDWSRCRQVWA